VSANRNEGHEEMYSWLPRMVQAAYHRKLLKADIKVHLHRLTLSGLGTRLSEGWTNSALSPSKSVAGLPKHGPVSIHGSGPKKSGCKLSGHLDDKRCQLNRSMQHFVEVYWREFEILRFFLDADLTAAPLRPVPFGCNPTGRFF
jgi:hypothetical protein